MRLSGPQQPHRSPAEERDELGGFHGFPNQLSDGASKSMQHLKEVNI